MGIGRDWRLVFALLALLLPAGCASPRDNADSLAARHHLTAEIVDGGPFDLYTLAPRSYDPGQALSVYIEGDGFAFINRWRLSDDPTPHHPIGLELAAADGGANVVYVARPCQYVTGAHRRGCHPAYWSIARTADEVIAATNTVIDHLLAASGARKVRLTGYSGGGAVALLVAARRSDVVGVVTVAGVLDTDAWTRLDDMAPLALSLNPAAAADRLALVPQFHWIGAEDDVVPAAVARSYADHFPAGQRPHLEVVNGQRHDCCWVDLWPALLQQQRHALP